MHSEFGRNTKPTATPIFRPQRVRKSYLSLCETLQKWYLQLLWRDGVSVFEKIVCVIVGCAISYSECPCKNIILIKGVFNSCHPHVP